MSQESKFVVVGSIARDSIATVDHLPHAGETVVVRELTHVPGGKAFNVVLAMLAAGELPKLVGAVGDDGLLDNIAKTGLDTSLIEVVPNTPSTQVEILLAADGSTLSIRNPGAGERLSLQHLEAVFESVYQGDTLVVQNDGTPHLGEILKTAANIGMRIFFNASPYSDELVGYVSTLNSLTEYILVVNKFEARQLLEEQYQPSFESTNVSLQVTTRLLSEKYQNALVIVTAGESGVCAATHPLIDGDIFELFVPAYFVENVVDPTGAGDTFLGYFIVSLLQLYNLEISLRLATVAAALAVTKLGASSSIPSMEQVAAVIEQLSTSNND